MDLTVTEDLRARAVASDDALAIEALASAARDGEAGAFDLLARRLSGRLAAVAYRSLGDRPLAEEAVQETLVRIYRALPRYRTGSFLAWAFTILHRACADLRRRERRHPVAPIADVAVADDAFGAIDLRAAVEAALARVPEPLRDTFILHQQGLSYDDVARVLDIPVGTVRSRLHETRRLLRVQLAGALAGRREEDA